MASVGVLEWTGDGVLLRAQADDLNWIARELARLPFDFSGARAVGAAQCAAARRAAAHPAGRSQISDHILSRL